MTGTNCDLFTHKSSRSYLNHLVYDSILSVMKIRDRVLMLLQAKGHDIRACC
jgi:hypothetical protein